MSQPSILHLGSPHGNIHFTELGSLSLLLFFRISAVLVRTLGQYYNAETFHFKFMSRITNSEPNLKVASKTTPSKNYSHNFHTPILLARKLAKKVQKLRE
jgi:hypothetical protein